MAAALNALLRPLPTPIPHSARFPLRRPLALPLRRLDPARLRLFTNRRSLLPLAALDDESHVDINVDNNKDEIHPHAEEESKKSPVASIDNNKDEIHPHAEEEWKKSLEVFKEEALKLKEKSQQEAGKLKEKSLEAYNIYSEKAMVALLEASENLKIEAEKARRDLARMSKEISEEGKVYLGAAAKNSPDEMKDIVETFASVDELKHVSVVRDFYVGIPYGGLLVLGGFLSFMLTGSISAIRFGVILGSALLALGVVSLRSWKKGEHSPLLLKGQTAIATILFIREWRVFSQVHSFPSILKTLISGVVLVFYIYRNLVDGGDKDPSTEQAAE